MNHDPKGPKDLMIRHSRRVLGGLYKGFKGSKDLVRRYLGVG